MKESIYTIPEVAQYLKMSKSKVYSLVQTGQLPHIRIGKNVRVRENDLAKWIDAQSQDGANRFHTDWANKTVPEFGNRRTSQNRG